jgi:hypothetical protein
VGELTEKGQVIDIFRRTQLDDLRDEPGYLRILSGNSIDADSEDVSYFGLDLGGKGLADLDLFAVIIQDSTGINKSTLGGFLYGGDTSVYLVLLLELPPALGVLLGIGRGDVFDNRTLRCSHFLNSANEACLALALLDLLGWGLMDMVRIREFLQEILPLPKLKVNSRLIVQPEDIEQLKANSVFIYLPLLMNLGNDDFVRKKASAFIDNQLAIENESSRLISEEFLGDLRELLLNLVPLIGEDFELIPLAVGLDSDAVIFGLDIELTLQLLEGVQLKELVSGCP